MNRLKDKVALITGAGGGLGKATAILFSGMGAKLVLADIDSEAVEALAGELDNALAITLDVSCESAWDRAIEQTVSHYGKLDILVNNAGIDVVAPLLETSLELYNRVVSINQTGCFLGMRTAAGVMNDGGSIINISSLAGMQGFPGRSAYAASKFAVRGMTKVAALELASRNIRVNSVHPGAIDTAMHNADSGTDDSGVADVIPLSRIAAPEEIANMILFLASEDSSYATGSEFVVDGGMLAGTFY